MDGFSSAEIAFQAEDVGVTIIPSQNLPPLDMAGWRSPQLKVMRRAEVPLWFAVLLKRQGRCSIVWPDWLDLTSLKRFVDIEHRDPSRFAPLPWLWQPISHILLTEASEDLAPDQGNADDVMQLIQELRELRISKLRASIMQTNESHLKIHGLGAMELNEARPVLCQTMRTLQKIRDARS